MQDVWKGGVYTQKGGGQGGPALGSMLKPTSWADRGGSRSLDPPWIRTCIFSHSQLLGETLASNFWCTPTPPLWGSHLISTTLWFSLYNYRLYGDPSLSKEYYIRHRSPLYDFRLFLSVSWSPFSFPVCPFPFPDHQYPFPVCQFPFPVHPFPFPVHPSPFPPHLFSFPVHLVPFPVHPFPFPVHPFFDC